MSGYHETDPTRRFSNRVDDYVKYRPRYPAEVLEWIAGQTGLEPGWAVADIGSGTGILSRRFLDNGNTVYGVEPNAAMRAAAEAWLRDNKRFHSVDGRAEHTGLPAGSVDLVTAAQAFHWFDAAATAREWRRILKPGGYAVLVWNTRQIDATAFMREYEALLVERAVDYRKVDHRNVDAGTLRAFYESYTRNAIEMIQLLDYAGFEGRLMSSSYAPAPGHPGHDPMRAALRELFDTRQRDGIVEMRYTTEIYAGRPAAGINS